jgi:hypothetical protein
MKDDRLVMPSWLEEVYLLTQTTSYRDRMSSLVVVAAGVYGFFMGFKEGILGDAPPHINLMDLVERPLSAILARSFNGLIYMVCADFLASWLPNYMIPIIPLVLVSSFIYTLLHGL